MSFAKSEPRVSAIFDFIVQYKQEHDGNSPTIREIGDAVGLRSSSTVNYYLQRLVKEKKIYIADNLSRSIEVIGGSWAFEND